MLRTAQKGNAEAAMRILIQKERRHGETRVSATPETVKQLTKAGAVVLVETGAGERSFISDDDYESAGATVSASPDWGDIDLLLGVTFDDELLETGPLPTLRENAAVVGFFAAYKNPKLVQLALKRRWTCLSMELVPRITRAQKMDALSSQASIAGYKAVLIAAAELPKYFPLLMTAAGTVKPARVVVIGAGVAGLQAIATAKRLGAVVEASDVRPAVKEQVESLGGRFIEPPELPSDAETAGGYAKEMGEDFKRRQQETLAEHLVAADVVIATALIPGKPAPRLISAEVVAKMKPGSVIVDLAVENGGNCELSELNKNVRKHGVMIFGHPNLPATLPADASMLYARNVSALVLLAVKGGEWSPDFADDVIVGSLLCHAAQVRHEATAAALELPFEPPQAREADKEKEAVA